MPGATAGVFTSKEKPARPVPSFSRKLSHVPLEQEQQFLASREVGRKLFFGQGRVQKLAVAGNVPVIRSIQITKGHRPVGELPLLDWRLYQGNDSAMAAVPAYLFVKRFHGLLFAFQRMHHVAVL